MQVGRLFEIVYILLEQEKVTAKELAEHFEISTRTIYRDIETLSGAGIPVYMSKGKNGGIALLPEFVLNKAVITEKERKEILSSLFAIKSVNLEESDTALKKLGNLFGTDGTDWIEVDFGFWADGEKEAKLFTELKRAILEKRVIQFFYTNAKGEAIQREVESLKLTFKGASWYLYGYCSMRKDLRFFKLKRMKNLELLNETFTRKIPKKVPLDVMSNNIKEVTKVKLKFSGKVAYRVYDDFENYEKLPDGSFLVEDTFELNEWFMFHIISYGEDCQILEPTELKTQIKETLLSILKGYEGE